MDLVTLLEKSPAMEKLGKAALNRWKLETLTGLLGYRAMQHHQSESEKNQEAENQRVRKELWGYEEKQPTGEEMGGHTILGDITHPTPIIMNQAPQQNNWVAPLLAAALAAGGGYLYATKNQQQVAPAAQVQFDDETISVGLGKIEDYESVK